MDLIDLNSSDHHHDIRADENGVWIQKGSPVAYVSVHTKDNQTNIFRRTSMGNHPNHFKITQIYYCHSSSPDFQRIITTAYSVPDTYMFEYIRTRLHPTTLICIGIVYRANSYYYKSS